ncbi:purine-nucleoside phosphorylase [Wenzhouxiangella limi]|uniref:Purine nucleoside phosphorylase DeoD-type n=1 Tax=Wenzhouxiangella limi TaxID=2707351 RepID=A0A845UYX2_9GAMM|nr:purine-nucleoside phosphorylase [Wenzhouxiangella limi]NDY96607.1 purine-nucleoside phosphorylase [Wenzhouxiangella limi]
MATLHIEAAPGEIAESILLPGDPLRARAIAERFLDKPVQFNRVRNMLGFTGNWKGHRISVMGSGMGIPSISIYAHELISQYGVKKLVRVGSCGAVADGASLRDVVIGLGASTDSGVNRSRFLGHDLAAIADFELARHADAAARARGIPVQVGNLFSGDLFYAPDAAYIDLLRRYRFVGVEMEAAGLYGVATELGARALTICTVANHIITGETLTSADSQQSFHQMVEIALDALARDEADHD